MTASPVESVSAHDLDNPAWTALTTVHDRFAEGAGRARRFRREVSAFAALQDFGDEAWSDLARLVGPSADVLLCHADGVGTPPGWISLGSGHGHQMVLNEVPHIPEPAATRALTDHDVDAMVELVALTEPGPFRRRTIELGGYHGVVDNGRLLAMAGQRLQTPTHTEISAVCTHPDARRRGYGAAITTAVARYIVANGSTPMLHVAESNDGARRVYESLGFATRTMITFAAFRSPPAAAG